MSNGNDLKNSYPIHISQMYDYVFNEEEMKKNEEKQDKKRNSTSIFFIAKREQDVDSRIHLLHLAINKNKKHNQLYLDEESQCIFRYYG